ncbi:hypothetical protein cypCar_00017888 [Cyprinus carpio]|nr:hypothetical protein cypCar_00017888 [Cyprinus carpio]
MEFIKEEIEDMSDPEPSRIKHEDTEEPTGWTEVKRQRHEVNEVEEEHCKIKTSRKKEKNSCTPAHSVERVSNTKETLRNT